MTARVTKLEDEFDDVLQSLQPTEGLLALIKAMFRDAWDKRLAQASEVVKGLKRNIKQLDKQIDQLLDRMVDASKGSVVSAYEKRISRLEREKVLDEEQIARSGKARHTFQKLFEHAIRFLASPWSMWESSNLTLKKMVLRWAFVDPLPYCRNEGLRTPNSALPFKASDIFLQQRMWDGAPERTARIQQHQAVTLKTANKYAL